MLEVKVEVRGKNQNCSADSSTTICMVESSRELFSRDLGELLYSAESAGYMFVTDEVYKDAMEAYNNKFTAGNTFKLLLSQIYNDTTVKISIKSIA